MPDIGMCLNHECPLRDACYRYRAIPSEWQSYAAFKPVDGACESFWPIEGRAVLPAALAGLGLGR